jgi:hypothetical protein
LVVCLVFMKRYMLYKEIGLPKGYGQKRSAKDAESSLKMTRSQKWYRDNEKRLIKKLGLTPSPGSGAGWLQKEDGHNDNLLVQLKSTDANSFRLNLDDMRKLEYHAMIEHKVPVFIVEFIQQDKVYLVINQDDLKATYEALDLNGAILTLPEDLVLEEQPETHREAIKSGNKQAFWKEVEESRVLKKRR